MVSWCLGRLAQTEGHLQSPALCITRFPNMSFLKYMYFSD